MGSRLNNDGGRHHNDYTTPTRRCEQLLMVWKQGATIFFVTIHLMNKYHNFVLNEVSVS